MRNVEVIDIAHNKLSGYVSNTICQLPMLTNFTFSDNYFNGAAQTCLPSSNPNVAFDDANNCLPGRKNQKTSKECLPVLTKPVDCSKHCGGGAPKQETPKAQPPLPPTLPPVEDIPPTRAPVEDIPPTLPPVEDIPPTRAPVEDIPPTRAPVEDIPPTKAPVSSKDERKLPEKVRRYGGTSGVL